MFMAKKDQSLQDGSDSKIEAIKNLIFGENIQEYNHEFETLKAEITSRRNELMGYVDDTRKELMMSIDTLSTDVNIRISDLEEALNDKTEILDHKKVNRSDLGDLLIRLGENIKA